MTHKLGKYMVAEQAGHDPNIWYIHSNLDDMTFSNITWDSDEFVCEPFNIVLDEECFFAIANFLKKLNKQGRISTTLKDEKKEAPPKEPNSP